MNAKIKRVSQVLGIMVALTMLSSLLVMAQPQPQTEIFMVEITGNGQMERIMDSGARILVDYNTGQVLVEGREGFAATLMERGFVIDTMPERTTITPGIADIAFDWAKGEPQIPANLRAPSNWNTYIVAFVGPIQSSDWTQQLVDLGASVHSYVPNYGLVVRMDQAVKAQVSALPNVAWVGTYHPAYKISPDIAEEGTVMAKAMIFNGANIVDLAYAISGMGATVNAYSDEAVGFVADISLLPAIARLSDVEFIYNDAPVYALDLKANYVHDSVAAWYPSWSGLSVPLLGETQVIGIQDTGFDEGNADNGHCDFFDGLDGDRVVRFTDQSTYSVPDGSSGGVSHGTHCAGLVAADGWCWETWIGEPTNDREYHKAESVGVLPRARLSLDGVAGQTGGLTPSTDYWTTQYGDGARTMSNSWGSNPANYGADSATADTQMNGDERMIIFAAGNEGPGSDTLGPASQAKNGLCIGAAENFRPDQYSADDPNMVADFSSRGGTFGNGRIKPDLVTVGTAAISAFSRGEWDYYSSNNLGVPQPTWLMEPDEYSYSALGPGSDGRPDYAYMQGTSMACPNAAGYYAMVREYIQKVDGNANPSSVLPKAMLINGAMKGTEELFPYPGYDQGWGRINIKNSLFPDAPKTIQKTTHTFTATGAWEGHGFDMNVKPGTDLKVTVVWKDVSGAALSRDVDLLLIGPASMGSPQYRGNAFSNSAPYFSVAGANANRPDAKVNGHDGDNNVEQVWIPGSAITAEGTWTLRVTATNMNGNIPIAVVMSADIGPQTNYAVDLTTEYPTTFSITAGGNADFQFKIYNFGTQSDNIAMSHDSPFTITWSPTSPVALNSAEQISMVAKFSAGALSPGIYEFRITGTSQGDGTKFDNLFLTVEVLAQRLPYQIQVTSGNTADVDPSVITFVDNGGTRRIMISFIKTTATGKRITAAMSTLDANGEPGTWTEVEIPTPSPDYLYPTDPRIYHMSGGSYRDRVFIVWTGHQEGAPEGEESSGYIAYADRTNYGSWTTVLVDRNSGSNNINVKRVNFLMLRPSSDEILYCFEHLDYGALTDPNPSGVDSHYRRSTNGGSTWGTATLLTPGDGNFYFFPNGNVDNNEVAWVWFYWRTPSGNDRDLRVRIYDGSWAPIVDVWDTTDNIQFPTCWSTTEGAAGNRNYFAVTRDQGGTSYTLWTGYVDGDFTSASPPGNSANGWGNTHGPFGSSVSDSNYMGRPILAGSGSADGYSWVAYMENDNPYGVPNMDTLASNDGFATTTTYRVTADSYAKGHQMLSTLTIGTSHHMYEVFHSSHGTMTEVDYNVYLIKYSFGWDVVPDTEGPITTAVIANPNPVEEGYTYDITANIDDTQTGFSTIQAAQYWRSARNTGPGTPTWPGTAMTVSGTQIATATANGVAQPTGCVAGDYFYIWVRGQDSEGNWGDGSYVRVDVVTGGGPPPDQPPAAPVLVQPGDGATGVSTDPTLQVTVTCPQGETMTVRFYNANGDVLLNTQNNVASGSSPSYVWTGRTESTTYNWYVTAQNSVGTTPSATWSFTTADFTPPAAPTGLTVEHWGSGANPYDDNTLNWTHDGTDVDHYNIYRASSELGTYSVIDTVPVGTNTYCDLGMGQADATVWWYRVRAVDAATNEELNTVSVPEPAVMPYLIDLTGHVAGDWVFVSFPIDISGNIATILDDADTTWDVAKWYDGQTKEWKTYRTGYSTTLSTINNQMGVWLHLAANGGDQMLRTAVAGLYPAGESIQLYAGWNMVGYPSATNRLASNTLPAQATIVSVWQAASPYINDQAPTAVTMSHGNAYWVYVTADCTWTVDP